MGVKKRVEEKKKQAVVLLYVPMFSQLFSCHCKVHSHWLKQVVNPQLRLLDGCILPRLPPSVSRRHSCYKSLPGSTGYCCQA